MAQHNELGKRGEELAINYLQNKGYLIVEKNYRFHKAEIDIIAHKENVLIAVEVKTRTTSSFGNPQDFVNQKKIQLLVKAMNNYVEEKDSNVEVRFDIIAIVLQNNVIEIEHLKDAFLYF